jgi:hypothetical protein
MRTLGFKLVSSSTAPHDDRSSQAAWMRVPDPKTMAEQDSADPFTDGVHQVYLFQSQAVWRCSVEIGSPRSFSGDLTFQDHC